jgi:hypothetical protein
MKAGMRITFAVACLVAMVAAAMPVPGHAQPQDAAKERERRVVEQLRRAQAAQQQAVKERDEQAAARAALEAKLKDATNTAGRSASQAGTLRRDLDKANALLDAERSALEQSKAELAAASAKARANEEALEGRVRKLEAQNDEGMRRISMRESQLRQLQSTAEERAASVAACSTRSEQLFRAGNELLDRLQQRGADESDALLQWTRIRTFDEVQRWRDRLDEIRSGVAAEKAVR